MQKDTKAPDGMISMEGIFDNLNGQQKQLIRVLTKIFEKQFDNDDPSHDISHSLRVLNNALYIAYHEGGDLEIIIAAALLHDIINIPKTEPRCKDSSKLSAQEAEKILNKIDFFPNTKIEKVKIAIREHSYSQLIKPEILESKIVQDADRLDSCGAISLLRTFASVGTLKKRLYDLEDPFWEKREPNAKAYGLDLVITRLVKVKDTMNTDFAKQWAEERTEFLFKFIDQLKLELFKYYKFE